MALSECFPFTDRINFLVLSQQCCIKALKPNPNAVSVCIGKVSKFSNAGFTQLRVLFFIFYIPWIYGYWLHVCNCFGQFMCAH